MTDVELFSTSVLYLKGNENCILAVSYGICLLL